MPININIKIIILLLLAKISDPIIKDAFVAILPNISESLMLGAILTNLVVNLPILGKGIAQLFWGEFADKFGRKTTFIIAEICIIIASFIIIYSSNNLIIIAARFLQGLSSAGTTLTMFAIIADIFPHKSHRIPQGYALLKFSSLGFGAVIPYLAFFLTLTFSWKSILWLIIAIKLLYLMLIINCLPETMNYEHIARFKQIKELFPKFSKNMLYTIPTILGILCYMWIYSYFNAIDLFRRTPFLYSSTHAINLFLASLGGILNIYFLNKQKPITNIIFSASIIMLFGAIGNAFITVYFGAQELSSLYAIASCSAIMSFAVTFITSNTTALAVQCYPQHTGVSLAIYGCCQYVIASIFSIFIAYLTRYFSVEYLIATVMILITIAIVIFSFYLKKIYEVQAE